MDEHILCDVFLVQEFIELLVQLGEEIGFEGRRCSGKFNVNFIHLKLKNFSPAFKKFKFLTKNSNDAAFQENNRQLSSGKEKENQNNSKVKTKKVERWHFQGS